MTEFGASPSIGDMTVGLVMGSFLLVCCIALWWAARRGMRRRPLQVAYWLLQLYAVELVVVSVLLLPTSGLWYALGGAGLVGAVALAVCGPQLRRLHEEAEARRLMAKDCL
jgi:hypothetical protein